MPPKVKDNITRAETAQNVVALAMAYLDAALNASEAGEVRLSDLALRQYLEEPQTTRIDLDYDEATKDIVLRKTRVGGSPN